MRSMQFSANLIGSLRGRCAAGSQNGPMRCENQVLFVTGGARVGHRPAGGSGRRSCRARRPRPVSSTSRGGRTAHLNRASRERGRRCCGRRGRGGCHGADGWHRGPAGGSEQKCARSKPATTSGLVRRVAALVLSISLAAVRHFTHERRPRRVTRPGNQPRPPIVP